MGSNDIRISRNGVHDHSRNRLYTRHGNNEEMVLATWSQRICQRCNRFLAKRELKWCDKCRPIVLNEQRRVYKLNHLHR